MATRLDRGKNGPGGAPGKLLQSLLVSVDLTPSFGSRHRTSRAAPDERRCQNNAPSRRTVEPPYPRATEGRA